MSPRFKDIEKGMRLFGSDTANIFGVFLRVEIDTMKMVFTRDFIVILSHRSYFVFSWILGPNQCTCNCYEYE